MRSLNAAAPHNGRSNMFGGGQLPNAAAFSRNSTPSPCNAGMYCRTRNRALGTFLPPVKAATLSILPPRRALPRAGFSLRGGVEPVEIHHRKRQEALRAKVLQVR